MTTRTEAIIAGVPKPEPVAYRHWFNVGWDEHLSPIINEFRDHRSVDPNDYMNAVFEYVRTDPLYTTPPDQQAEIDQLRSLLSFYERLGMVVEDQRNELRAELSALRAMLAAVHEVKP